MLAVRYVAPRPRIECCWPSSRIVNSEKLFLWSAEPFLLPLSLNQKKSPQSWPSFGRFKFLISSHGQHFAAAWRFARASGGTAFGKPTNGGRRENKSDVRADQS